MHHPEPHPQAAPQGASIAAMTIGLLLGGFALFAAVEGVAVAPCWLALVLPILIAVPIWLALRESALFSRRALLHGSTSAESRLRSLLWQGHLTSGVLLVVAIAFSASLLALGTLLSAIQWGVLLANLLLLPWIYQGVRRRLQSEVRPEVLDIVTRGWSLFWANMALIALAFFIIDFAITGTADTRLADWRALIEQTFVTHSAQATCPALGWLIGLFAALDQFSWHWAQVIIPQLADLPLQIGAWLVFLLRFGLIALTFTLYLTGLIVLVERRSRPVDAVVGGGALAKTFLITLLILALPSLYASIKLRDLDLEAFQTLPEPLAERLDPCHPDAQARAELRAELDAEVAAELKAIDQQMASHVDDEVDALFAKLEGGVDTYLDWYFTVAGEYQRLGAVIVGDLSALMTEQLEQRVFVDTGFQAGLEATSKQALELAETQLAGFSRGLEEQLSQWQSVSACRPDLLSLEDVASLNRDGLRALSAAGTGATAGTVIATKLLSKTVAAKVIGKVAAKKSFQLGASLLAKTAAKKGASAGVAALGGAAICSPAGPGAIACGVGAAVVTWLAADKAFVEIDESLSREDMRADILEVLNGEKQALKDALNAQHETWLLQLGSRFNATLDGSFVPLRDGLR
ncbi:hypothetical protein CKO42_17335 [Lamprobacter modestohalophilus]|uniref:Uncharacterized protein n=1 Tax=Lamprobacter modestohalophilus TaxID=1064514 RepID=A0A9X0WB60_9GAMM|nr:hypothetical protein [Lamprobacter modestohalophilus]MBK1620171.1 hypothetical protein [Lamprobacter modestohalophilus]